MYPLISIIIPTRNRARLLARLLDSLKQLRYPGWEAIVVDDGSTDDTAAVAERYRAGGLRITYLYQPWQRMGAARNLALRHGRGSIVAFTDDDCVVDPGWLEAIAAAFETHPDALGVQGKTITDDAAITPFTRQIEQLEGPSAPFRTCNIAYRTDIIRELGGFDPHLIRGEDVVMGMRVLERGEIVFAPDAIVCHPPRPKEWADRAAWRMLLNSELHFKRMYPAFAAARSQTLSLQKPEHVLSRWVLLPIRRYGAWHFAYFRRHPGDYLRHVPLIAKEKLALFSLLPFFYLRWRTRELRSAAAPSPPDYPDRDVGWYTTDVGVQDARLAPSHPPRRRRDWLHPWRTNDLRGRPGVAETEQPRYGSPPTYEDEAREDEDEARGHGETALHIPGGTALHPQAALQLSEASPLISVVVPTRNRARLLPRLLAALGGQEYPAYEIIVVDDASTDETLEILRCRQNDGLRVIRLNTPAGSYAARNRGWREARGEIVAFTDDDCLPHPGWLAAIASAMRDRALAGVQGVTLAQSGEITPFTQQIEQTRPGTPYRTCNIAYRREILEEEGGFDERLHWYADNLLGLQVRKSRPIGFAADAVVDHPPRPKAWRDREDWLARFQADALYRQELLRLGNLSRLAPPNSLPIVLWIVRPLLKQSWAHLTYLLRHPIRYAHTIVPMAREKLDLVQAMQEYWRSHGATPASNDTVGADDAVRPPALAREHEKESGQRRPPLPTISEPPLPTISEPPLPTISEPPLPTISELALVSVVVMTRGRPDSLAETLAGLNRQTWREREVVVVEHGGTCDSAEIAAQHGARWISAPAGTLGAARQAGVREARGEIIAFTDDDCLPDPSWLETAVDALRRRPQLWGVQGRTAAAPGPVGAHAVRVSHPDPLYRTCNIAYRRAALERVQGFDPHFHRWFEDTALGARIREHGPIGWEPQMTVTHRAMPRQALSRADWRTLFFDERRLARGYRSFYLRTRGPGFLPTVIIRWLVGSPLKILLRELPRAAGDPGGYVRLAGLLLRERAAGVAALTDVMRAVSREPLATVSSSSRR